MESAVEMERSVHNIFVRNLKACKGTYGISHNTIMEHTSISSSHLTKLFTGKTGLTLFTICRVASFLGVPFHRMIADNFMVSEVKLEINEIVLNERRKRVYTKKQLSP